MGSNSKTKSLWKHAHWHLSDENKSICGTFWRKVVPYVTTKSNIPHIPLVIVGLGREGRNSFQLQVSKNINFSPLFELIWRFNNLHFIKSPKVGSCGFCTANKSSNAYKMGILDMCLQCVSISDNDDVCNNKLIINLI